LLDEIDAACGMLGRGDALRDRWAARVETIGREVELSVGGEIVRGFAERIDYDGSLAVRLTDGTTRSFSAGEVTLQAPR
jgi:BirA family biotin operon repressor/biotin-[acetyl-CoA-carboxylase] ligase